MTLPHATRTNRVSIRPLAHTLRPNLTGLRPRAISHLETPPPEIRLDPYGVFKGRFTMEGGIVLTYRAIDTRVFLKICRFLGWAVSTGVVAWFVFSRAEWPSWLQITFGLLAAIGFGYLFSRPKEISRSIEIRSDSMVLDGTDVFWRDHMELGWPQFQPDKDGNLVMRGGYGTRMIEFLTVHRFDEKDCGPEVLEAHVTQSMQQLWLPHV